MTISTINGFNLDKTLDLLGPVNHGEYAPQNLIDYLSTIIANLVITILRHLNYYFGDQKWYDNDTARDLVITYINTEKNLDLTLDCHKKIAQIFEELHFRNFDLASRSYAVDLSEMAYEKGIEFLVDDITDTLDFGALPSHKVYQITNGNLTQYATGNLTLKANLEKRRAIFRGSKAQAEQIFLQFVDSIEKRYRELKIHLDLDAKIAEQKYASMFKGLFERSSFPDGYTQDGSLIDPRLAVDIDEFDFDEDYRSLKDPLLLFNAALMRASNELNLDDKFNRHLSVPFEFDETGSLIKKQGFFNFFNFFASRDLTDEEIDTLSAFAIIDLLRHACIDYTDCHHKVYFSPYISAAYQKPYITFITIGDQSWPLIAFKTDLFSTENRGSDPENALSWVKEIENFGDIKHFKAAIKNRDFSGCSYDERRAYDHIFALAKHLKLNYLETIRKHRLPSCSSRGKVFEDVVKDAKSSTEFFKRAFLFYAQEYANLGLFDQEDLMGANISRIQNLLAKRVVFETLILATPEDDFTLKLNDFVRLKFGRFFSHEINSENTSELICKERAIENELFDSDFDSSLSLDPIYTAYLFKNLQMKTLGSNEIDFLRLDLLSESEFDLFKLKYDTSNDQEDLDEALSDYEFRVKNTRFLKRKLSKQSREVIKELRFGIYGMASSLLRNYFKPKLIAQEISEKVTFLESVKPKLPSQSSFDTLKTDRREAKEVEFTFIPSHLKSSITIKQRRERVDLIDESYRVNLISYYNQATLKKAISKQNDILSNTAQVGNCGFGALAMEIFEGYVNFLNIDEFSWQLREIVASYIRANSNVYLDKMLYSTETFSQRLIPILNQRLEAYCSRLTSRYSPSWISEFEFEVISRLFGVRIEIINLDLPCKIGNKGSDIGLILPNLCYGSNYKGAPIRLMFKNGNHFEVIKLKN